MKTMTLFLSLFLASTSLALDTTEEYAPGLSDFEFYTQSSQHQKNLSAVLGYGHSLWFNPSVAICSSEEVTLGNFANIYNDFIVVDLLAAATFQEQTTIYSLGSEITIPLRRFLPYLKTSLEKEATELTSTVTTGISFQQNKLMELFAESKWNISHKEHASLAVGLNYKAIDKVEIISDAGINEENTDGFASLGLIWTRD